MAKRRKMKKTAKKAARRPSRSRSTAVVRRKGRGRIARKRCNAMNPANSEGLLNIGVSMGAGAAVGWGVEYLVKMATEKAEKEPNYGVDPAGVLAETFGSNRTVNGAIFAAAGVALAMFGPQLFGAKSARVAELAGCAAVGAAGAVIVRDRLEKAAAVQGPIYAGPIYSWNDRAPLSGPVYPPMMSYQPAREPVGNYARATVHPRFA